MQLIMVIAGVLINVVLGLLYFHNALKRNDLDLALAILIAITAFVLAAVPTEHPWWNYLAIGWAVLFFLVLMKIYFGEIIMGGTLGQRVTLILGLLIIALALILGLYFPRPEWMSYIPSF